MHNNAFIFQFELRAPQTIKNKNYGNPMRLGFDSHRELWEANAKWRESEQARYDQGLKYFEKIRKTALHGGAEISDSSSVSYWAGYDGSSGTQTIYSLLVIIGLPSFVALMRILSPLIREWIRSQGYVSIKNSELEIVIRGDADCGILLELLNDHKRLTKESKDIFLSALKLYNTLSETEFNINDLQDLAFQLNIEWDDLLGKTKESKTRSLVMYCEKHGRMLHLRDLLLEIRPNLRHKLDLPHVVININTGGGAYIAGDVNSANDFIGRDKSDHTNRTNGSI